MLSRRQKAKTLAVVLGGVFAGIFAFIAAITVTGSIFLCGCRPRTGEPIALTVAGSTSVQPFVEILAEEYAKRNPGKLDVNVQGGGSSAGVRAALSGTADIGMLSRELAPGEEGLTSVIIARDAIAVVVHPSNPVQGLTAGEARAVFAGRITCWSQLGGPKGPIQVVSREEGSGTRGAFDDLIMHNEDVLPRAIVQDSNGSVRETVAGDKRALGYISLGLVDESVRALEIDGAGPTPEDLSSGLYSLVRPFLFVVRGEVSRASRDFIDFVMSDQGQSILVAEGLIAGK